MKAHRFASVFPLMNDREYKELKEDIEKNGVIEPITLFEEQILDGRNRYKACKELKIIPKFENYKGNNALQFVISTNLKRRHLNESQRAMVAIEHRKVFDEEARSRRGLRTDIVAQVPPSEEMGKAREKLGQAFSVSGRYIDMAETIKEKAPKRIEAIKKGEKKISSVYREIKIKEQKKQIEKLKPEKAIQGVFDVIVIDPPWKYNAKYDPDGRRGSDAYPEMSLDELKKMKLPVNKDCVLWLWVTNNFMKDAHELIGCWGFELKTILTWDKEIMGLGAWLRNKTEHCILATKGKPYFNNTKWTTLISEKRTSHSTKPEIFYKMVEEICAGRKLDYFARKKREGWDVYGDEVTEKVQNQNKPNKEN